jgi:putative spermidine/putrescine transport system substrate-binding protein
MKRTVRSILTGVGVAAMLSAVLGVAPAQAASDDERLLKMSWSEILKEARGQTVRWWMWAGDAGVNQYVDQWVAPRVKSLYGITLQRVPIKETAEGVQQVVGEKQAGKMTGGTVDLNWISGDNLFTMKQAGLLFRGYRDKLPNAKYINWEDPVIKYDRATPVDGAAIAWGRYQQVFSYDSAKVQSPPKSFKELGEWIKKHPGRFTYPAPPDFTGTSIVLTLLYEVSGGAAQWAQPFDQALWDKYSPKVWEVLNSWKPYLWRKGETYPESVSVQDQLFGSGELWWSSSMYYSVPGRNVAKGLFPKTTRTVVFDKGTISAAHSIGIPFNSSSKAAAMVVIDFLIGPEPQYQKALPDVWGIGTVLDMSRLPPEWKKKFEAIPRAEATLNPVELDSKKAPAPHAKYVIALDQDFKKNVLQKR